MNQNDCDQHPDKMLNSKKPGNTDFSSPHQFRLLEYFLIPRTGEPLVKSQQQHNIGSKSSGTFRFFYDRQYMLYSCLQNFYK